MDILYVILLSFIGSVTSDVCSYQSTYFWEICDFTPSTNLVVQPINSTVFQYVKSDELVNPEHIVIQDDAAETQTEITSNYTVFYCRKISTGLRDIAVEDSIRQYIYQYPNVTLPTVFDSGSIFRTWLLNYYNISVNETGATHFCVPVTLSPVYLAYLDTGNLVALDDVETVPLTFYNKIYYDPTKFHNLEQNKRMNNDINLLLGRKKRYLTNFNPSMDSVIPQSSEVVYVTLDDGLLRVTFGVTGIHSVLIQKAEYANMTVIQSGVNIYEVKLPSLVLQTSGVVTVTVYSSTGVVGVNTFDIVGVTSCMIKNCVVCPEITDTFSCLPTAMKWQIGLSITLLVVLICCLFPILGDTLKWIWSTIICKLFGGTWWYLRWFNQAPLVKNVQKTVTHRFEQMKHMMTPEDLKEDIEMDMRELKRRNREHQNVENARPGKNPLKHITRTVPVTSENSVTERIARKLASLKTGDTNAMIATIGLILIFLPLVMAQDCTDSLFLTSNNLVCANNGTAEVCTFKISNLLDLPVPGAQSCITVRDSSNKTLGVIKIKYVNAMDTITLSSQYYTARWLAFTQSVKRCSGAGHCVDYQCQDVERLQIRDANGELTDFHVVKYPGRVSCQASCGCAGCGCFLCDSACLYSGFSLVPFGNVSQVLELATRMRSPTIRIEYMLQDGTTYVSNTSVTNVNTNIGQFTVQILVSLTQALSDFPSDFTHVIINPDLTKIGPASKVNIPKINSVGDIQANAPLDFSNASPDAFIFDPAVKVDSSVTSDSIHYTFSSPGILLLDHAPFYSFPVNISGNTWFYSNGILFSNIMNPGALLLSVTSPNGLTFTKTENVVCPAAVFVSANGCYSCLFNAHILVNASSKCAEGFATFTVSDPDVFILNPSQFLSSTTKTLDISLDTSKARNMFNLIIIGSSSNVTIPIDFVANYTDLVNNNDTGTSNGEDVPGFGSGGGNSWTDAVKNFFNKTIPDFFDGIFFGKASWWQYLIFAFVIFFIILTIGLLLAPAITWYHSLMVVRHYKSMSTIRNMNAGASSKPKPVNKQR